MKILLDIGHPCEVHVFKNFVWEMQKKGHIIKITSRSKDISNALLELYNFEYTNLSKPSENILGMIWEFFYRGYKLYRITKIFKPDLLIGAVGVTVSPVGKLLRKPVFLFYDTEIIPVFNILSYPLATYVCTPDCHTKEIGKNQVKYNGYKELSYLHPNRFTPNETVINKMGFKKTDKFFVLRFVSWKTIDHIGGHGIGNKKKFIESLEPYGKVLITSETPLPNDLEKYRFPLKFDEMHHLMAFATMVIGESPTMATESAVLGIPAIYISNSWRGYTNQLESKYGLIYNFTTEEKALPKIIELLNDKDLKEKWTEKREIMLRDKLDVTAWMIHFVESKFKDKNNPI